MDYKSRLHIYSLGYVTEDIEEDSPYLKVVPIEQISDKSGVLGKTDTERVNTKDINGNNISVVTAKTEVLTAKWLNMNDPNRLYAPNIHKGETVLIWKYSGDRYFWTPIYNEVDLRLREKATHIYSNKDEIKTESKLAQVYYWTIDTINKYLRLHTGDEDGEATTYDMEINTKDGLFIIVDGLGNEIQLESNDGKLTITTNVDVIVNTKHVTVNAEEDVTVNTKVAEVNASDSATVNTKQMTINSTRTDINP